MKVLNMIYAFLIFKTTYQTWKKIKDYYSFNGLWFLITHNYMDETVSLTSSHSEVSYNCLF